MPDKRMLVLDLDGTTLNSSGQLAEADVGAVHALRKRGIHVTIATGRLFSGTDWVARALGIQGSVAVMNGCELVDVGTEEAHFGRYVSPKVAALVGEVYRSESLSPFLFGSGRIHYGAMEGVHRPYLEVWTPHLTSHHDIFAAEAWDAADLLAVSGVGDAAQVERAKALLLEELPEELGIVSFHTSTGHAFMEVRHRANKGIALAQMAAERGLTPEDCVAVGDWINDKEMLEVAGLSFAMGHAADALKDTADEVLEAVDGGAVAEVASRVWGLSS